MHFRYRNRNENRGRGQVLRGPFVCTPEPSVTVHRKPKSAMEQSESLFYTQSQTPHMEGFFLMPKEGHKMPRLVRSTAFGSRAEFESTQQAEHNKNLRHAAKIGSTRRVTALLNKYNADWTDTCEHCGKNALMMAASRGHVLAARQLIESNKKKFNECFNNTDKYGRTALWYAARFNQLHFITYFIKAMGVVKTKELMRMEDINGLDPLMALLSMKESFDPDDVVKQLLPYASIKRVDKRGYTALMYAAENNFGESVDVLCNSLDYEGLKSKDNLLGETALMKAATLGNYYSVRFILNKLVMSDTLEPRVIVCDYILGPTDTFGRGVLEKVIGGSQTSYVPCKSEDDPPDPYQPDHLETIRTIVEALGVIDSRGDTWGAYIIQAHMHCPTTRTDIKEYLEQVIVDKMLVSDLI